MKQKIRDFLVNIWYEIEYRLKCLCGRPSPLKRFILVLIIGGILAAANIYFVISSIYNIGKHDAEKNFIEVEHIKQLEIERENSNGNQIKIENRKLKNNQKIENNEQQQK